MIQVLLNYIDHGMDLSAAIEEPRVHDQLYPLVTDVESTFWRGGMEELEAAGHNLSCECKSLSLFRKVLMVLKHSISTSVWQRCRQSRWM